MTRRIYISDTNIWIDFRHAGLLDALFSLPFKLCCTDFVLEELHNFDTGHLLRMGLTVETFDEAGIGRLFGLMSAHNNSSLASSAANPPSLSLPPHPASMAPRVSSST